MFIQKEKFNSSFDSVGDVFYHKEKNVIVDMSNMEKTKIFVGECLFSELKSGDPAFESWVESALIHAKDRFFVWNSAHNKGI